MGKFIVFSDGRPLPGNCSPANHWLLSFKITWNSFYPLSTTYISPNSTHEKHNHTRKHQPPHPLSIHTQGDPMKAGQGARGGREAKARYIGLIWEKMTKQMVSRWWLLFTHNLTYICGQTSGLLLNGHEKTFIYGCCNKSLCVYFIFCFCWGVN